MLLMGLNLAVRQDLVMQQYRTTQRILFGQNRRSIDAADSTIIISVSKCISAVRRRNLRGTCKVLGIASISRSLLPSPTLDRVDCVRYRAYKMH